MNRGEPKRGNTYHYHSTRGGKLVLVKVINFGRSLIVTEGIKDGRRRDVPVSRLKVVEKTDG